MQKKPSKRTTLKKRKRETPSKPVPNTNNTMLLFVVTHGSYEHYGSRINTKGIENDKFMSFRVEREENDTITVNGKPTPFVNIQRINVAPPGICTWVNTSDLGNIEKKITTLMRKKTHQLTSKTDLVELVKEIVKDSHAPKDYRKMLQERIELHNSMEHKTIANENEKNFYKIDEINEYLPIAEKSFLLNSEDFTKTETVKRSGALVIKEDGLKNRIKAVTKNGVLNEEFMKKYHQMKQDYKMNKNGKYPTVYLSKLIKSIGQFCKDNPNMSDITNLIIIDFTCANNHFDKTLNKNLDRLEETLLLSQDSRSRSKSRSKSKPRSKPRSKNGTNSIAMSHKNKSSKNSRPFKPPPLVNSRFGGTTQQRK